VGPGGGHHDVVTILEHLASPAAGTRRVEVWVEDLAWHKRMYRQARFR